MWGEKKGVDSGHSLGMKVLVDVKETVGFLGIWCHLLVNHSSVSVFIKRLRVGVLIQDQFGLLDHVNIIWTGDMILDQQL